MSTIFSRVAQAIKSVPPPPPPPPAPEKAAGQAAAQAGSAVARDMTTLGGNTRRSGLEIGKLPDLGKGGGLTLKPTKDAAEARERADQLMFGGGREDDYRTIERDAADVNEQSPFRDARAERVVEANRQLEAERLDSLEPEERAQYERLSKGAEGDPRAQLSMQLLLVEGKLPGQANSEGRTLLQELDQLSTAPVAEGIDRQTLMSEAVQEMAFPSAINQHGKGTCTMTSTQILMAMEHPAEYARLIGGLASPEGKVELANGDTIAREADWQAANDGDRSTTGRLFQPALMEYGNGDGVDYNNTKDAHSGSFDHDQIERATNGLLGQEVTRLDRGVDNDEKLEAIAESTRNGDPVLVSLAFGQRDENGDIHGGHEILVTRVEGDRVYYNNPWGTEESMSASEFKDRAWDAVGAGLEAPPESLWERIFG